MISIEPMIRLRKQRACHHRHVEVDDHAASLTCLDCGAEIDPWWYIRELAHHEERAIAHYDALEKEGRALLEKHNVWVAKANETIQRLSAEITHLTDVKNRLYNEQFGGRLLGSIVRHPRRKSRT